MRILTRRMIFVTLGLVWFQACFAPVIEIHSLSPDFLLLAVVFIGLTANTRTFLAFAFLVGALRDLMADSPFGLEIASVLVGALAFQQIVSRFDRRNLGVQLGGSFLFVFVCVGLSALFLLVTKPGVVIDEAVAAKSFLVALYTTLLVPFSFRLLDRLYHTCSFLKQYELF